jgi:two-component system, response regulator / RNA-binding antiterminator
VALHSAEAKLEERAIVDQAKACLIRERRLSEPDAYRWPLGVSVLVCAHS